MEGAEPEWACGCGMGWDTYGNPRPKERAPRNHENGTRQDSEARLAVFHPLDRALMQSEQTLRIR
jgi:hypothetical protein